MPRRTIMNQKLTPEQKNIRRRIIEISYEGRLSHLGSCLSVVDIIESIYKVKDRGERFILSSGHAGIALYVILEKYGLLNPQVIKNLAIHPDRNPGSGIDFSSGSLGHGLPVALGMALAERNKNVYCVLSDGECAEGSVWEAFRIGLEQKLSNLKIVINANGWGAYDPVSLRLLSNRIKGFGYKLIRVNGHAIDKLTETLRVTIATQPLVMFAKTTVEQFPFLQGQDAHYYVMTEEDYILAMEKLK